MPVCEDLATKAELNQVKQDFQQLKSAINGMFGDAEDGTGQIDVVEQASLEGTATQSILAAAGTAIVGFSIKGGGDKLLQGLVNGSVAFEKVLANGTKQAVGSLTKLGSAVGKNATGRLVAIKGIKVSSLVASIVMQLVATAGNTAISIGTLELIKMNTANSDAQFNQWNRDYSSLLNLYSQAKGDIAEANRRIEEGNVGLQDQVDINLAQATEIAKAQKFINDLEKDRDRLQAELNGAITDFNAFQKEVESYQDEIVEVVSGLQGQVVNLGNQLTEAQSIINAQTQQINDLKLQVIALEQRVENLENNIIGLQTSLGLYQVALKQMEFDLNQEIDLLEVRVEYLEARIIVNNARNEAGAGGGAGAATAARVGAQTQNGILDLASSLTGISETVPVVSSTDIINNSSTFNETLANLISQVNIGDGVRPQDIQDIRDGIKIDMETVVPALVGATVLPGLNILKQQTSAPAIASATATGVCSTTKPGGCMNTNVTQPIQNQLGNMIGAGGTAFSAANNALLTQMKPVLTGVSNTVKTIKDITNTTLGIVSHASHGLEAIQKFADTAWKATHADKILAATTTVLTIHNGMMLSNNLLSTVSEATNVTLEAIGLRDSTDTPIDIGKAVKDKIQAVLSSALGAESYAALTTRIAKTNRIYQASINMLDTTKSLFDNAQTIAEIGIEHTGQIGNALKEAGAVYEDAYGEMLEKANPQNAALRRLGQFRENVGDIEEIFSSVSQISGEVVDTKENFEQLKSEKAKLLQEMEDEKEKEIKAREEAKKAVQVEAEIEAIDFKVDPPSD